MKLAACLVLVALAGCSKQNADKSGEKEQTVEKKEKSAPADEEPSAESKKKKKAKKAEEEPPLEAEGLGVIPAWEPEKSSPKKCSTSAAAKARIKALQKGDDEKVSANEADLAKLEKELAAGCHVSERELADALNSGGFQHYKKKKYDVANRWWRAALVVRPSFVLARYNLACGLALDGASKPALEEMKQLARAAKAGDAAAANFLEKAKSDADLKSIRDEAEFKKALEASVGGLVGPRKEPELSAEVVKLLPPEFKKGENPVTGNTDTYKPAVLEFWTWRPDASTELVVGTLVHDPSTVGKPKGDMNNDYGGIVVVQRGEGGSKPKLLLARKTGESPPTVAAGPNKTVLYGFYQMCGDLSGTLSFKGGKVEHKEKTCDDLYGGAEEEPKGKLLPKCSGGTELVTEVDDDAPYCSKQCKGDDDCKPRKCVQVYLVDEETGHAYVGAGKELPFCGKP